MILYDEACYCWMLFNDTVIWYIMTQHATVRCSAMKLYDISVKWSMVPMNVTRSAAGWYCSMLMCNVARFLWMLPGEAVRWWYTMRHAILRCYRWMSHVEVVRWCCMILLQDNPHYLWMPQDETHSHQSSRIKHYLPDKIPPRIPDFRRIRKLRTLKQEL